MRSTPQRFRFNRRCDREPRRQRHVLKTKPDLSPANIAAGGSRGFGPLSGCRNLSAPHGRGSVRAPLGAATSLAPGAGARERRLDLATSY